MTNESKPTEQKTKKWQKVEEKQKTEKKPVEKQNLSKLFIEMGVCIFIPTLILKKLSGAEQLGSTWALVVALSLPLLWGVWEFVQSKKVAFVPALGFISILLTGGIGLLRLDVAYIAIKEALIPFVIGVAVLITSKTKSPLVKLFLYNDNVVEVEKVDEALEKRSNREQFNTTLRNATSMLAGSFFLSAILNYSLAKFLITSPAGTTEFNSQLGSMNLWSYPVIVLPCMVVMMYALFYIFRNITKLTGMKLEDIIRS